MSDPAEPVDARLWQFVSCHHDILPCSYVSEAHTVEVDRTPVSDCTRDGHGQMVELVPREPLWAGHTYANTCRNRRGLVAVGGGAAFVWPLSPVVEAETRVAVRFGSGHWHFGGLLRLGWDIGRREYAPMPQFGLFIGTTSL